MSFDVIESDRLGAYFEVRGLLGVVVEKRKESRWHFYYD